MAEHVANLTPPLPWGLACGTRRLTSPLIAAGHCGATTAVRRPIERSNDAAFEVMR